SFLGGMEENRAAPDLPAGSSSLEQVLAAMQGAQHLKVGDPRSGEVGEILDSVLELLQQFSPQFQLNILLFQDLDEGDARKRVFSGGSRQGDPDWLAQRQPGQAVTIPAGGAWRELLPASLLLRSGAEPGKALTVAVPLYAPDTNREAGLLFLQGRTHWSSDYALKLGAKLSRFVTHRWQIHEALNRMINVDSLTGLFNRAFLDAQLSLLVERARRKEAPLALIIADIDKFKSINTDFGLTTGDQVLQMAARRLQEEVRQVDVVCRRGGEEFGIILPDADFEAAREVALRLLDARFETTVTHQGKQVPVVVRFSYGVSVFPDNAVNAKQLHHQAEQMEAFSKDRGRNRCNFFCNDGNHLELRPNSVSS
nr:GGDEF domain-containing protein [Candidatus Krumholzibacteria bacterium]